MGDPHIDWVAVGIVAVIFASVVALTVYVAMQ